MLPIIISILFLPNTQREKGKGGGGERGGGGGGGERERARERERERDIVREKKIETEQENWKDRKTERHRLRKDR